MEAKKRSPQRPQPFHLSLRVSHPFIDPEEISRELGLRADHSFKAGEARKSTVPGAVHARSYWLGTVDPSQFLTDFALAGRAEWKEVESRFAAVASRSLDSALASSLMRLRFNHAAFFNRIRSEGGDIRLLVTLSSQSGSGFTIIPQLAKILSELEITVEFELSGD